MAMNPFTLFCGDPGGTQTHDLQNRNLTLYSTKLPGQMRGKNKHNLLVSQLLGGFIFGFILLAGLCGVGAVCKNKILSVVAGFLGLAACHLLGAIQFGVVTNTGFVKSLLLVSVPYLIKDGLSVVGAFVVGGVLRKRLAQANLMNHEQAA